MRPAFIDAMSWEMAEVYGAVTDQILINLAHYFPYYDARNFPRSSITYQADMLAQMGQVNKETMAIIRRNLVGVDKYLNAALEQVIIDSVQAVNPELWKAVKKGIFMPPQTPVVSPNQYRAFNLYYTQAANKLNLVNTVMLESTQAAYRATVADIAARVQATQTALDIGAGEVVTGVSSWNTATAHAIKRLQTNGITGFIDHGGHRWSAEAYVAMDIRTTMFNTGRAAVWETNQNFGNDLYQVSYHNGARPLCYPWQSKVISSTDNARVVADLDGYEVQVYAQSETSYGEPAGLFGINCKHYPTPFIPGVSIIRGQPQDEETNERTYAESQEQRRLERKLREEKRDVMMAKAQGADPEEIKRLQDKAQRSSQEIQDFCDRTGRARHKDREAVYTKRDFPDKDKYNVAEFERKQKETIDQYFGGGGGAQQGYTFGQMTPNEPQVAPTTAPPTPTAQPAINPDVATFNPAKTREEAEAYALEHFGTKYSSVSYKGIDIEYANTCNRVLTDIYDKMDIPAHTKWDKLKGIEPMNMRSKLFKGTTAEAAYHWGGDGTLYINPTYYKSTKVFAAHKAQIDELTKTVLDSGQTLIDAGKVSGKQKDYVETLLRTGRQCVAQSHDFFEASIVHEGGHMLDDKVFRHLYDSVFGTTGVYDGAAKFIAESRMKYGANISGYAISDNAEYIAESFCSWWYGETDALDPKIVEVFERATKK